jgi:hypothetical protein
MVSRALYEAVMMALVDTQTIVREAINTETALREMLSDARCELDMLRAALGVPYEPHQNLSERLLERAQAAGKILIGD